MEQHLVPMEFTRIKGAYSTLRKFPPLGKIRLGMKVKNRQGVEYPVETAHFVAPPEVQRVYGEEATELDVMFYSDDETKVFVQKYAMYGSGSGLKCHGDGERAARYNEHLGQWVPQQCPCPHLRSDENPKGQCGPVSHLMVMLPKVNLGGCYQITTRSFHATVGINSSLDLIRALAGRIALVPLKLRRVPTEIQKDGRKQTHYILTLTLDATLPQLAELRQHPEALLIPAQYQIEAPIDINPATDPVDIDESEMPESEMIDAADLADMTDEQMADIQSKLQQAQPVSPTAAKRAVPLHPPSFIAPPMAKIPTNKELAKAVAPPAPPAPTPSPVAAKQDLRSNLKPIDPSIWQDIITAIDDAPNLRNLKEQVKKGMKINSLHLIPAGQHEFLRRFREEGARLGYAEQITQLLSSQ